MRPIDVLLKDVSEADPRKKARNAINKEDITLFCPNCLKHYVPMFPTKQDAMTHGKPMHREQWISGICSDECWDEYLGPEE